MDDVWVDFQVMFANCESWDWLSPKQGILTNLGTANHKNSGDKMEK